MADTTQLSPGQIEKILTKSVKQAVAQSNISSTRSGNKELGFLVKEIVSAPFESEADVQKVGTALGQKIVELSKESDKSNLDAGVIRQLRFKQDWSAEFDIPEPLPVEKVSKKATKSTQTVVTAPARADESPETLKTPDAEPVPAEPEEKPAPADTAAADAADATDASVVSEEQEATTMSTPNPDSVDEAVVAPEVAATSPKSAEAEALLTDESDETQTLSSEPNEVATSEESTDVTEAAEAEVIEKVNSGAGSGATTAMSADPESVAAVNAEPTTREKA